MSSKSRDSSQSTQYYLAHYILRISLLTSTWTPGHKGISSDWFWVRNLWPENIGHLNSATSTVSTVELYCQRSWITGQPYELRGVLKFDTRQLCVNKGLVQNTTKITTLHSWFLQSNKAVWELKLPPMYAAAIFEVERKGLLARRASLGPKSRSHLSRF